MAEAAKGRLVQRPFIHPVLLPLYPLLTLYAANVGEARFSELALPALTLAAAGLAIGLALRLTVREASVRGILFSLSWAAFYAYGWSLDALHALPRFAALALYVLVCAALLLGTARVAGKRRAALPGIHQALNVFALAVVLLPGAQSVHRALPMLTAGQGESGPVAKANPTDPDIYFLIFDAYARADYLQEVFGFDNGPFLDALRERGFHIADRSRSNYIQTQMSLAATLNMDYLGDDLHDRAASNWDATVPTLVGRIRDSRVAAELRARGYEIVTCETWLSSASITKADRYIKAPSRGLTEFQLQFFNWTPLRPAVYRLQRPSKRFPFFFALEALGGLTRRDRPMFVFVHVLAPHLPHTVDANGELADGLPYREGYRNEVRHLNRLALRAVDAILSRNPNSVIVMQGDHGPWSDWHDVDERHIAPWQGTRASYIRDRTAILNAIRLPDQKAESLLYPEITPVNTFRAIFAHCFGAGYPLLPDRSYVYSEDGKSYEVVTEVF